MGFGVVHDTLQPRVIGWILECDDRRRDLGYPLLQSLFDTRRICLKVSTHIVRLVISRRTAHFVLIKIPLHVHQASEPVDDGPEVGNETKKRIDGSHSGAVVDGDKILGGGD